MDPKHNEIEEEHILEVDEKEHYDYESFLFSACEQKYDELLSKIIVRERGINLDIVERKMPDFYRRLVESGWVCSQGETVGLMNHLLNKFYN